MGAQAAEDEPCGECAEPVTYGGRREFLCSCADCGWRWMFTVPDRAGLPLYTFGRCVACAADMAWREERERRLLRWRRNRWETGRGG